MERNRVKIICNPYKKEISYKRWGLIDESTGEFDWIDLGSKSKLITDPDKMFRNVTIQHSASNIIEELVEEYNEGKIGLDIVFEGTDEDYLDFEDIVNRYYQDKGVEVIRGEFYFDSAKSVMNGINKVFSELSQYMFQYRSDEINGILKQYMEATKTAIPICVMGMYSTGKSAFINALIGEEILPSAVDPTTARNYRISETTKDKSAKVKFTDEEEIIEIAYENDKYNIIGNIEGELRRQIQNALKEIDKKTLERNIYYTLYAINEYAGKTNKIGELIEVEIPFRDGLLKRDNACKFVIYDTPGSDSVSHEEHLNVLKRALGEQTNGLPIILTSPKNMDRTGADKLLEMVDKIDGKLDLTNVMIVVNQSDESSAKSLEKVKKTANSVLTKWRSNRLYFISAIMGLGSKKDDYNDEEDWIDDDYYEVFTKNINALTVKNNHYKQLYMYNQMADYKYHQYMEKVENISDKCELIYINSGLHCVETEIIEFAEKYALYNKCAQAQEYLKQAINCIRKQIEVEGQKKEDSKNIINAELGEAKCRLTDALLKKIQTLIAEFEDQYPRYMKEYVNKVEKEGEKNINTCIDQKWDSLKKSDKRSRVNVFLGIIKVDFQSDLTRQKKTISNYSQTYCLNKRECMQQECCKIVKENEDLTSAEQAMIQNFIMNLPNPEIKVNVNILPEDVEKYFLFIPRHKIDVKRTKDKFDNILLKAISEISKRIMELHTDKFKSWVRKLQDGLISELASFNPDLREYAKQFLECQKEIEHLEEQEMEIKRSSEKIKKMFNLKSEEV